MMRLERRQRTEGTEGGDDVDKPPGPPPSRIWSETDGERRGQG